VRWIAVSGGGIYGHATAGRKLDATLFAAARSGYIRLDSLSDGRVRLGVIVVAGDGAGREGYARDLTPVARTVAGQWSSGSPGRASARGPLPARPASAYQDGQPSDQVLPSSTSADIPATAFSISQES